MFNLFALASLLFVICSTGIVSVELAFSRTGHDVRSLEALLCVLAGFLVALGAQRERLAAIQAASPGLLMLGLLHLWLGAFEMPAPARPVALMAGFVEVAIAIVMTPLSLFALSREPALADEVEDAREDLKRAAAERQRLRTTLENHVRASDALAGRRLRLTCELQRTQDRLAAVEAAVRPPNDVLCVPDDLHPRLREHLLAMARDLGWRRIRRFPTGLARAANDGRVGYIDGRADPKAERRYFWAAQTLPEGECPVLISGEMPA